MHLVKQYYSLHNIQDEVIRDVNKRVVKEIIKFEPKSVFEFGCNNGKNLTLLPKSVTHLGIDINKAVIHKYRKTGLNLLCGDESLLTNMGDNSYDVTFTCSVLNHIEKIDDIVKELKRIAKKGLVCVECNHEKHWRWFRHNYEKLGFTDAGTEQSLNRIYDVWIMFI